MLVLISFANGFPFNLYILVCSFLILFHVFLVAILLYVTASISSTGSSRFWCTGRLLGSATIHGPCTERAKLLSDFLPRRARSSRSVSAVYKGWASVFRPAPSRVVNLGPDEPASPTDWDTHSCVLNFYPPDRRAFRAPLRRSGLWGPMFQSVLTTRRHLYAPRIWSGRRGPTAGFVHPLLKYLHVPFNLSGRQEPMAQFAHSLSGHHHSDGLGSPPGRRALSPEYPVYYVPLLKIIPVTFVSIYLFLDT